MYVLYTNVGFFLQNFGPGKYGKWIIDILMFIYPLNYKWPFFYTRANVLWIFSFFGGQNQCALKMYEYYSAKIYNVYKLYIIIIMNVVQRKFRIMSAEHHFQLSNIYFSYRVYDGISVLLGEETRYASWVPWETTDMQLVSYKFIT